MNKTATTRQVALFTADQWEHVCPQIRVIAPLISVGYQVLPGVTWQADRPQISEKAFQNSDIVVIQRNFPQFEDAYRFVYDTARTMGKPVMYEIDDLLTEMPVWHKDKNLFADARTLMLKAMIEADMVICSTNCIADTISYTNSRVRVLPNYIIDEVWLPHISVKDNHNKERQEPATVIGYVGGHSHAPDLDMLKPVFSRLTRQFENSVRFRFWGCPPPMEMRQWSNVEWFDPGLVDYRQYAQWLVKQQCDIFIAPLKDCHFNTCKSALKYLEYSLLGVPGVYSDPGPYSDIVNDGINGFLAKNLMEWVTQIGRLVDDEDLRQSMGQAAKATVMESHLLSNHRSEWSATCGDVLNLPEYNVSKHVSLKSVYHFINLFTQKEDELEQYSRDTTVTLNQKDAQISDLESRLRHRENIIDTIIQSPGWRFLAEIGRVRKWFIPAHSRREQLFFTLLSRLGALRQQGIKGLFTGESPSGAVTKADNQFVDHDITFKIVDGVVTTPPDISLIVTTDAENQNIDVEAVRLWASDQTIQSYEILNWDRERSQLVNDSTGEISLNVSAFADVLKAGQGTYLAFASQSLLEREGTYLEANLIALKTENLAFTVNLMSEALQEQAHIEQGQLPGSEANPYEKLVIHKSCVTEEMSLDFSAWEDSHVVGKIYHHTTNNTENHSHYAYKQSLPRYCEVAGNYIINNRNPEVSQEVHPVDTVSQMTEVPAAVPTVFVVMPFVAVGGAENVALDMIRVLRNEVRFVIISTDHYDHSLGTKADAFRQITPYVYTAPDFMQPALNASFWRYLVKRFNPLTFYIANGSESIYAGLTELARNFPNLKFANQVYDHRFGWIERYDSGLVNLLHVNVGCNRKIRDAFIERGVPPEKAFLIENGIDCTVFDPDLYPDSRKAILRKYYQLPEDTSIITFMARLHPQKRPMDFLEVARRFRDDDTVYFLIVGGGPLTAQLDYEILRIGLKNISRRPFSVSSDILALSDVFVLPSEYEGMPLTILESMALGTPVVVTDVGNNKEVLEATNGGMLVEKIGDIQALSSGIMKLLDAPPDMDLVRSAVMEKYNVELMARKYYKALVGD